MTKAKRLTADQVRELKKVIRTGEPITMIAERLAPQYDRPEESFRMSLYHIAKRTYKIAEWKGRGKRKLNPTKNEKRRAQQLTLALETPASTTPRIEKYADHIRFYF
jgi:hypothetical protein